MKRIPFHRPTIEDADIPGVVEVLREGWVTTGPRCRDFERAFSDYLGGGVHAVAVNSGTAALHLGLESLGVGEGDKVLTTPWTFTATAEVIRYLGADPIFVDVDEEGCDLTAEALREAYGRLPAEERSRVRAVIPVHYAGRACAIDEIAAWAAGEGLRVLDDAAHALPTHRAGTLIGNFGDITAFSFYATKTLCTGEGGMAVTADESLARRMRTMRLHGISRDVFDRYRSDAPSWYYEVVAPGFKYNMSDIAAALGLSQLTRVDAFREAREAVARQYDAGLDGIEGLRTPPPARAGDGHAWHLYALRVEGGRALRDALIEELAADGIATSVHFIPLHLQPYYRDRYGLAPGDFPVSSRLFEEEISLPIYPSLRGEEIQRVIDAVPEALERARKRAGAAAAD